MAIKELLWALPDTINTEYMRHKLLGFKSKRFASEKCFSEEKLFESSNLGFSYAPKKIWLPQIFTIDLAQN